MTSRHQQAIDIQQGACNMIAIANVLVKAIQEAREENVQPSEDPAVRLILHQLSYLENAQPSEDPAVRLILHQLSYLANVSRLDSPAYPDYDQCMTACETAVNNSVVNNSTK